MELTHYARVVRTHWLLVVTSLLACTVAAGVLAWTRTPAYAARTQLFVSTPGIPADLSQTYQGGLFSQQRVLSYARIVSSPPVAEAVITRLGLPMTVQELQDRTRASVPTDTVLIDVTVRDESPQRAQRIASALAEEFSRFVTTLEARPGERNSPVKVSVTSRAQLPADAASPQKPVYLAFGLLAGLVLGIGAALLREAFDRRIRGGEEAAGLAGAPVVGSIAEAPDATTRPLIVVDDPFSVQAEAYRRLRTNLGVLSIDHGLRSFIVASAVGSEGKTVVAANLGIAFAQAGYRVALVDADLRGPRLTDVLGVSPTTGLTDLLTDDVPVEAALETWRAGLPLEVLGSGPRRPNPSELLGSQRFASVMSELTDRADVVIVDTPALLPVADAAIVARLASGVVLVTRVGATRPRELDAATQSLRAVDARVVGVVLNRLPPRRAWRYLSSGYASDRPAGDAPAGAKGAPEIDAVVRER